MALFRWTIVAVLGLVLLPAQAQITIRGATEARIEAPGFQAAGGAVSGTGDVTPAWPAHQAGDIALLFIESSGGQAANFDNAQGFVAVADSPQSTNNGNTGTRLTVYWRRATSGAMANPQVNDPGNHVYARILTYRGVIGAGDPWDVTAGATKTTASTSVSMPAVTTTVANTLIVQAAARESDSAAAAFSNQANANLVGIAERSDEGTTQGNGGGIGVWDGVMEVPGDTGNTTATVTNNRNAYLTIALRPPNELVLAVPGGTVEEDVMLASVSVSPAGTTVATPAGWTLVQETVGANNRLVTFRRVAGASEPASYTFTLGGSATSGAVGGMVSYSGVDPLNPIDVSGANATPSGTSHTATGVTTVTADAMVVTAHSLASSVAWAPPAGMTERVDIGSAASGANAGGVALGMSEVLQPDPGGTGNKVASVGGNADTGAAHIVVLRSSQVLSLRLDESTWGSYPPQDASGNGLHGTANAGAVTAGSIPAIAGAVGTCRYGNFNGSTSYVEVAHNALLNLTSRFTVMAWINPNAVGPAALKTIVSKDENFEFHLTNTGEINWWWQNAGGTAQQFTTAGAGITAGGGWTHVAVVYAPGAQTIYVNGVARGSAAFTGGLFTNTDPLQVGSDQGFAGRQFDGQIDEVRVFRHAMTAGEVAAAMNATRACTIHHTHYAVSYPNGSAFATCEPARVRITAHDGAHVAVAPPPGTLLTLNTSTGNGFWVSPIVTGTNASWTPSGADNGQATYAWDGDEAFIEMDLRRNAPATLNLNLADGAGRSEGVGEDLAVSFDTSVLRVTADGASSATINTQIAGKRNTEGANQQALYVQAVRSSPAGVCTTLFQNQNRDIEFAAVCNNPSTCSGAGGTEFQVTDRLGVVQNVVKHDNTVAPPSYTAVSLAFSNDANAMAPLVFRYGDAGQMTLYLRFTEPSPPGLVLSGTSNAFVVRPFGIAIRGANAATPIAHSSTDSGTVLAAAGDNFTMTLAAYKWQSAAEDANNDGFPDFALPDVVDLTDNGLTPSFAPATLSVNAGSNLPGVATGAITRGAGCAGPATVAAGSWSGGAATLTDWCYSEAGNVQVAALAVDYLSPGVNVIGLSSYDGSGFAAGHVGRFRPKHFAVSAATLSTRHGASCAPASSFTYLDEPLRLGFTLTAQNAQNATTQNYNGSYAKLGLTTFGNWVLGARDGATDLSGRLDTGVAPTGSWSNGVASGVVLTTAVTRAAPDTPDGPFTATAFGIAPVDSDGVAMDTLDLDADNNAVMDRKNLGVSAELRFGRLRVNNALGSAKLALPVPLRLEYWNGTAFAVNTADSCTTLARNTIALGPYTGALAPGGGNCKTFIQQDPLNFTAGLATATLAAPTGAVSGSVLLTPQLRSPAAAGFSCDNASSGEDALASAARPYLLGRWNDALDPDANAGTTYDDNPSGRASFGLYGSRPRNFIYFRENY